MQSAWRTNALWSRQPTRSLNQVSSDDFLQVRVIIARHTLALALLSHSIAEPPVVCRLHDEQLADSASNSSTASHALVSTSLSTSRCHCTRVGMLQTPRARPFLDMCSESRQRAHTTSRRSSCSACQNRASLWCRAILLESTSALSRTAGLVPALLLPS